jgi:lipopolysaccharide/colanic/teichoic acid biosynthesis glycosyltransferase
MLDDAGPGAATVSPRGEPAALEVDGRIYVRKHGTELVAKRLFDVVFAVAGLIAALPLFAVIAVLIKLDSRGPVFYKQTRVGRHRRPFKIWKFRKMYEDLPTQGPSLTRRFDFRLTRLGRVLERTKLDELPQLLNVLTGEMSIIGPRPEVPKFVEHYPERWQAVLSVKPGIFGPNQLRNRNESELYPAGCTDVEGFYVTDILPEKLDIDAEYARRSTWAGDLWLMVRCLIAATLGTITWQTVISQRVRIVNLSALWMAGLGATAASQFLAGDRPLGLVAMHSLFLAAFVKPLVLLMLKVPNSLPLSATYEDFLRSAWCAMGSTALMMAGLIALGDGPPDGLVLALDGLLFLGFMVFYKLILHSGYLTFRAHRDRVVARRMIRASVVMAALGVIGMVAMRHGVAAWTESGLLYPTLLLVACMIRPALMVLMRAPRLRAGGLQWLVSEAPILVAVAAVGSCLMAVAVRMLGQPAIDSADLMLDAGLFVAMSSVYGWWQTARAKPAKAPGRNGHGEERPRERLLVAGSGIELGAFVAALAGLSERDYEIVGLLGPHVAQRGGVVGGQNVVGEFLDLPEILKNKTVDRLIILPGGIEPASVNYLKNTATERNCPVVILPLLSGIRAAATPSDPPTNRVLSSVLKG